MWTNLTKTEQLSYGNGCGIPGTQWMIPVFVRSFFDLDCRQHDYDYRNKGGLIFSKIGADGALYKRFLKRIGEQVEYLDERILWFIVATALFVEVLFLGLFFYKYSLVRKY